MTVSMRVMSAGDGYKYLLRTVAAADGDRSLSTPLTRYYVEAGTPPGQWLGSGVASLGTGQLVVGDRVSEAQLQLLMGMGRDPITGDPLGHAFPAYKSVPERIETRIADLEPGLSPGAKGEVVARIEAEETERGRRRAVAGFDFTFSVPKSASALWAVADAGTQALIGEAHHRAVAEVVAFLEREVAAARTGATAGDGAVAQVDVTGLVATAFDHFDSRAGDPHLHTHVVISNKVQTAFDGKWRSLDGRPMHAAVVALSELHEAVFADHMTRTFGVEWEARDMGALTAIVAPVASELKVSEPSIELEIHEVTETEGLSALRTGNLHLLLAERARPDQLIGVRGMTETFLLRDPYRVIVPPDWNPSMSVEELIRGPWIAGGSEYSSRRTLDEIAQKMGVKLRVPHPCRESPIMLSLVAAGLGAALVPQLTLGAHTTQAVQLTSGQLDPGTRVLSVLAKSRSLSDSAVSHVVDTLLDQAGRLSAESMGA